jgi:hypothetical protein
MFTVTNFYNAFVPNIKLRKRCRLPLKFSNPFITLSIFYVNIMWPVAIYQNIMVSQQRHKTVYMIDICYVFGGLLSTLYRVHVGFPNDNTLPISDNE